MSKFYNAFSQMSKLCSGH